MRGGFSTRQRCSPRSAIASTCVRGEAAWTFEMDEMPSSPGMRTLHHPAPPAGAAGTTPRPLRRRRLRPPARSPACVPNRPSRPLRSSSWSSASTSRITGNSGLLRGDVVLGVGTLWGGLLHGYHSSPRGPFGQGPYGYPANWDRSRRRRSRAVFTRARPPAGARAAPRREPGVRIECPPWTLPCCASPRRASPSETCGPSTGPRSNCAPASCWPSWGPTAPARPRWSGPSPAGAPGRRDRRSVRRGRPGPDGRGGLGVVPQELAVYPLLTARENLESVRPPERHAAGARPGSGWRGPWTGPAWANARASRCAASRAACAGASTWPAACCTSRT